MFWKRETICNLKTFVFYQPQQYTLNNIGTGTFFLTMLHNFECNLELQAAKFRNIQQIAIHFSYMTLTLNSLSIHINHLAAALPIFMANYLLFVYQDIRPWDFCTKLVPFGKFWFRLAVAIHMGVQVSINLKYSSCHGAACIKYNWYYDGDILDKILLNRLSSLVELLSIHQHFPAFLFWYSWWMVILPLT